MTAKPEFATNREGERVADAIGGHLQWLLETRAAPFELAIATAYFNPGGFSLIAGQLERVAKVRLLLGVSPDLPDRGVRHLTGTGSAESVEQARLRNALTGHLRGIEEDRDLLGFEVEGDASARRLIGWLRSGRVEVRRFEDGFLHGKAFLVTTDDDGVIAGSSNFTFAGLAVNHELNLGQYQPHVVKQVAAWYEEMWQRSVPFDLAALYEARFEPHNPHVIYLRMLLERYGAEIEEEAAEDGVGLHLTTFQRDGVWRAKRILRERQGVLVADGVGLGKTFLAGELIREAVQERRQRVLLIAPAALRDGPWRHFLLRHGLGIECLSYEELSSDRQLNNDSQSAHLRFGLDEYAMVVIDEAHAYRNPDTLRANVLRKLLQGTPPKEVVLLTATPVNNSLWDLYYLISYFVRNDAAFAGNGVGSLRDYFAAAMAVDPEDLSAEHLFDVLDSVAVRRTRHFVKRYYPHDTVMVDGAPMAITFPKPEVRDVTYDLDAALPGFFERFAHALDCTNNECEHDAPVRDEPTLSLARYAPSQFLRTGEIEGYQLQLAGLLRSGLLKRFESSAYAFARTCQRMADSHDAFLDLLDEGQVAAGTALSDWLSTDTEDVDGFLTLHRDNLDAAAAYDVPALRAAVEADRDMLRTFGTKASEIDRHSDTKLAALTEHLAAIAAESKAEAIGEDDERTLRKVIVFSYYADTVSWIRDHLEHAIVERDDLAGYRERMTTVTGSDGNRTEILFGFAPKSAEAPEGHPDTYDLLVSTDVLAEGVNLQQARHIINYDLPWNPMRLVQRHGRIDRIGSPHDRVFIRCTFPDKQLDALLGLEERLLRKISQAAKSIGVEDEVLPGSEISEQTFAETREEIERLRGKDATLFETGGELHHAFSGEEYRQELRAGLADPQVAALIRALPWGSGSGLARTGDQRGYVFCARIADHPDPTFAYVAFEDDGPPDVVTDTLTCLSHAHADPETPRVMDDETHRLAYEAWAAARARIFNDWQHATDPRNLQPAIPKAMRDAADILRTNPPPELEQRDLDRLVDAVEAPYGPRIQRVIREALRSSENPTDQARAIAARVAELGLQPAPSPEPLPVITPDDVHLVCWQAIVPELGAGRRDGDAP